MSDFKMLLPHDVEVILDTLASGGFSAYVVGGAVRDSVIGKDLGDFDITTDASPEETKALFFEYKTVDTGIKHGTVTVVMNHVPYEITTYRIDGDYKDKRHPDSVTFTRELSEDLKRRDFTVNAMAYSPNGGLVDLFGGVKDAESRIIKAVGDPYIRFGEDALRILRALRFAAVLDFEIEKETDSAARTLKESLLNVSGERIYSELKKLISGKAASRIMKEYSEIIAVVLGGVEVVKYPSDEKLSDADFLTRLAAVFLLNSDSPAFDAARALSTLKTDNLTRICTENVLNGYNKADFTDRRSILHSLRDMGEDTVRGIMKLGLLLERFNEKDRRRFSDVMSDDPVWRISDLTIGGSELLSMGYKGKEVGDTLGRLLVAVIEGECENTKASILEFLSK